MEFEFYVRTPTGEGGSLVFAPCTITSDVKDPVVIRAAASRDALERYLRERPESAQGGREFLVRERNGGFQRMYRVRQPQDWRLDVI